MEMDQAILEKLIREILTEKLSSQLEKKVLPSGIIHVKVPDIQVDESNRLDTGNSSHKVYTKDLFSLEESKRLGCGIMEMTDTTFDWSLNYDEIDYVIKGSLSIISGGKTVTAAPGEIILIPKGSNIQFSVQGYARFLYATYPADWFEKE